MINKTCKNGLGRAMFHWLSCIFSLVKSSGDHGDQTVLGNMTSESSAEESL